MYIPTNTAGAGEPIPHVRFLGKPIINLRAGKIVRTSVKNHGRRGEATREATKTMKEVFRNLAPANVALLDGTDVQLHIIPHDKQLTDISEFVHLRGQRTCGGRLCDLVRSTGPMQLGPSILYAIGEEDVAYSRDRLPHLLQGFAVSHDSALVVARFALTVTQKKTLDDIFARRRQDVQAGAAHWIGAYAGSSPDAYFASSTAGFFEHPRSVGAPDPARFTRAWIEKNDPAMHALLREVYQGA
jgi:hypothetical protein